MPVSFQIERLRSELAQRFGGGFLVVDADLYSLEGVERDTALDALAAGTPSPFVLVNGRLACSGAVDPPAVLDALVS
jgi:hypothetical protein